ncbi:MAG: hypothetical protein VKP70_02715 [Cyanobacteriota bacterium]|nr:hypothetical protein [Cyanobacteriota bacterium]
MGAFPGLLLILSPVLLGGCGSIPLPFSLPEVSLQPPPKGPQPKPATGRPQPTDPSLAPLATPQQVVRAVDLGRPDPFAAVLSPRVISGTESPSPGGGNGAGSSKGSRSPKPPQPLDWPSGLVFQGVIQGGGKIEALVQYTPAGADSRGVRSGSLRVGDEGSARLDSVLPPGWRVKAIDGNNGVLVLQQGERSVSQNL